MNRTYTLFVALLLVFVAVGVAANAQVTAPFAIGLRASPDGGGLNLRYFFNPNFALEGQGNISAGSGGYGGSGKSTTGVVLVEYHLLFGDESLRAFIGGGAHYGSWVRLKDISQPEALFGLDAILGFEYMFKTIPLSLSLDVKPAFSYVAGTTVFPNNMFGLTARFYIGAWEQYDSHEKPDSRE